jgi:subtilisin family serine protease
MGLGAFQRPAALADALQYATDREVVLGAATGNVGPGENTVQFPARHPAVLAVGATTRHDQLARFSSRGGNVDIVAPGADVCSTTRGGAQSTFSGTSMAAPHVAGAWTILNQRQGFRNMITLKFIIQQIN